MELTGPASALKERRIRFQLPAAARGIARAGLGLSAVTVAVSIAGHWAEPSVDLLKAESTEMWIIAGLKLALGCWAVVDAVTGRGGRALRWAVVLTAIVAIQWSLRVWIEVVSWDGPDSLWQWLKSALYTSEAPVRRVLWWLLLWLLLRESLTPKGPVGLAGDRAILAGGAGDEGLPVLSYGLAPVIRDRRLSQARWVLAVLLAWGLLPRSVHEEFGGTLQDVMRPRLDVAWVLSATLASSLGLMVAGLLFRVPRPWLVAVGVLIYAPVAAIAEYRQLQSLGYDTMRLWHETTVFSVFAYGAWWLWGLSGPLMAWLVARAIRRQ